ncbi:MAG: hypothetical protein GY807_21555 [Gammaproteobacteria bacterium]|nr:hypothetical protein [Gammaproteobacteria bacterium]
MRRFKKTRDEESVEAVTETNLQEQTKRYQGRGGTSAETRVYGFRPAFLDTQTDAVYPCCFSDGRPAPMHLFDGLPPKLILSYAPSGRVVSVKGSIISGFIRGERFYTREEVSKQVLGGTFPVNSTT